MFSRVLPEVSDHIFPFLRFNDLLRFRRVCKASKHLADDYLRRHGTLEKVIRINVEETSEEMTNFLALTYPINLTRFDLVHWRDSSPWDREEMQTFLDRYGEKITHLEIGNLDIPIKSPSAVRFFEGFPNLEVLRVHVLREGRQDDSSPESENGSDQDPEVEEPLPDLNLPSTFKRLKNLNVVTYSCDNTLLRKFLGECSTHLDHISHPYMDFDFGDLTDPGEELDWVNGIVDTRHRENPDQPNLQYYDLERFGEHTDVSTYVRNFYQLVTTCCAHGVKLQHVHVRLIDEMMKLDTPDRDHHGDKINRCVQSIVGLSRCVCSLELPVLEKIYIDRTSKCSLDGNIGAKSWPKLKELKLWVDREFLAEDGGDRVSVSRLLRVFFHGIRRENLETLGLSFGSWNNDMLPYPEIRNVCSSCPNIRNLGLQRWPGSDEDIAQLWGMLPLLEEVTFKDCVHLGDAAFIGVDVNRPVIGKATRLKSLELNGLNEMPGITDNLFRSALRDMPLKALYLEQKSGNAAASITLAGLEALLTGKFALTIEKFPLKGNLKLEGVTEEQLVQLEGRFGVSQV